jgi:methyl-accepting chemotaxis protein
VKKLAAFGLCCFCALAGALLGANGGFAGGLLAVLLAAVSAGVWVAIEARLAGGRDQANGSVESASTPSKGPVLAASIKTERSAVSETVPDPWVAGIHLASKDSAVPEEPVTPYPGFAALATPAKDAVLMELKARLEGDLERLQGLKDLSATLARRLGEMLENAAVIEGQNARLLEGAELDGSRVAEEIQALQGIQEALHQGTAVIDDLARSSKEVGPVIEGIFVVARKTNMLALNAAIEAARAGDQGQGFAVVAEEVRHLAEAATVSTQEVERFVEGLREKTASAIQVLQGASRIEETIPVIYRISDAFVSLAPSVQSASRSLGGLIRLVDGNVKELELLDRSLDEALKAARTGLERVAQAAGGQG